MRLELVPGTSGFSEVDYCSSKGATVQTKGAQRRGLGLSRQADTVPTSCMNSESVGWNLHVIRKDHN